MLIVEKLESIISTEQQLILNEQTTITNKHLKRFLFSNHHNLSTADSFESHFPKD
jgi:dephospho-CoA kinase